ncbi:MAG: HNH endonuclease [Bacteriovorax sp.]|nr:HNH endonuclease [Bacteriovorax sp.]
MATDPKLLIAAQKVTAHRAKTVIDHIIAHGFISTEDLKETYGYNHPPRAAGDVRDQGIPLETFKVTGSDGRKIAAYRFGDPSQIEDGKLGGRKILPKLLKKALIEKFGPRCAITSELYDESHLQIDHRVPYRIAGDSGDERSSDDFMLLSGSAQRQKSWACEHCPNYLTLKQLSVCQSCYWAYPESFTHVATKEERRVDIVFSGNELKQYQKITEQAILNNTTIQDEIKKNLGN